MKQNLLLVLLLIFGSCQFGQKLKKVKAKFDSPYTYVEKYQVLKSDPEIRHGQYTKKSLGSLLERGQYKLNEKYGIWTVYNLNNYIYSQYDYDKDSLVYLNPKVGAINSNRPPILIKGPSNLLRLIYSKLNYPKEAIAKKIKGRVLMEFLVSKQGEVKDIKVTNSPHELLTTASIRLIEENKQFIKFFPGLNNGEAINSVFKYSIVYTLSY